MKVHHPLQTEPVGELTVDIAPEFLSRSLVDFAAFGKGTKIGDGAIA
jgi:hypothetical protein